MDIELAKFIDMLYVVYDKNKNGVLEMNEFRELIVENATDMEMTEE